MWTLLTTLLLTLPDPSSEVKVDRDKIEGIATEELCEAARLRWIAAHTAVRQASSPDPTWEAPEGSELTEQPLAERYQQMVPIAVCVQVRLP